MTRAVVEALEERLNLATITVTTTVDNTTVDGKVSLREALTSANNNANLNADVVATNPPYGTDTIVFDATLFATPQTITLASVLPDITGGASFLGTTAAKVTVTRGATAIRLFNCSIAGVGNVSFSNLTITGGSAIANGAGINANDDNLTVTNCILSNNIDTATGGGIGVGASGGTITLTNSTLSGNGATHGGGIAFIGSGNLVMNSCTVVGNTSSDAVGGGGVFNATNTATIRDSTISGNHATNGAGGGVFLQSTATVTIQNSTIAFNDANTTGGGINRGAGTLSIESTIVAENTAVTSGDDVSGSVSFAHFCLIGETDGSSGITDPSNKTGTQASPLNPLIGALADNGGPTQTHLPATDSPLRSAGSNPAALTTDQRGAGYPRTVSGSTDIGAVEFSQLKGNWTGLGDGVDWIDPANWTNNVVPGPSDDVVLLVAADPTIVLSGAQAVRSMVATESLVILGVLSIEQPSTFNRQVTLAGAGDTTFNSTLAWTTGGLMTGTGETLIAGGAMLAVSNTGVSDCQRPLRIDGNAAVLAGGIKVLKLSALTMGAAAKLDLNDNDLILDYTITSPLPSTQTLINTARAGSWSGFGITSTTAKNNVQHNTTLGVIEATTYKSISALNTTFDGEPIDNTAVLIKYTYYGDANFNGQVDGGDYARLDFTFGQEQSTGNIGGWINGDFNGDGKVDGSDYALTDFAFSSQGATLRPIAQPPASIGKNSVRPH